MKFRTLVHTILSAAMLTGCANQPKDVCTLKGHINGLPADAVVVINELSHEATEPLAEIALRNGEFEYTDTFPEAKAVVIVVKGSYGSVPVMLNNGDKVELTVDAEVADIPGSEMKSCSFTNKSVKGSALTDRYDNLMSCRDSLNVIFENNSKRFAAVREAFGIARSTKNEAMMDSLKATEEYRLSAQADSLFFVTVDKTFQKTVLDNKDTFWGPLMMISLTSYLTPDQRDIYEQFSDEAKASYYGKLVAAELYPGGRPGDQLSDFTSKDANGVEQSFLNICKENKYIILDFWASWCAPCRKEIPNLKAIYEKHSANGLQIVSVSIDQAEKAWRKALDEEKLPWVNILDNNSGIAAKFHVRAVPTIYLVDSNGCLVAENIRGEELAEKIDELMK